MTHDPGEVPLHDAVFTIADVLALPLVREGVPEVLAGEAHLTRAIRWVHSGEFPDMPAVLKGGELLLTHGLTLSTRSDRQRRYVADLARAGLAGLVIELGPGMKRVPSALVEEACAQELPLVVLQQPIPWVEVTEAVHRTIVSRQGDVLERGQRLHDRFAALVASGADVADVLHALATSVGNPVVLTRDGEIIYSASAEHDHAHQVASTWEAVVRDLPHAPDVASVPVAVAGDPHWGLVSLLALDRPLRPFDRVALERAVPILALAFRHTHEELTLTARDHGEFLDALMDDAELDEPHAYLRAAKIGFAARTSWLVPFAANLAPGAGQLDERHWAVVERDLRRELASRQAPAVVGTVGHQQRHVAVVAGLDAAEQRAATAEAIAEAVRQAVRRTRSSAEVVVCVGPAAASWSQAGRGLRETIDALPAMRQAPARPWHDVSGPDLRRLLWALRGERALAEFVERRLAPLQAHDARGRGELLRTLEVYCAHGGRKAEAARALHLERQSLYKRLARIATLLDADLDDEDTLLGLHLALRAQRLLGGRT
ncbi:PucR family transcriptional regulator [Baekduia alba]|uniref:PucR family transcriptional regulator n=1 Tax=Baekduia alba TaxID=2997333 RepID=UPI002340FBCB|nr:PucR family transcriptional regulator [Baekduia alba]